MRRKSDVNWPVTILLILGLVTIIFPLYMTVVIAFKQPSEMTNSISGILSLPKSWSLDNFSEAMRVTDFWHSLLNSVVVTGITVVISIVLHSLIGYAIGRNKAKSKFYKFIYLFIVSGMFVPFAILMMPLVKQTAQLGIANIVGVIVCYVVFYMPMNVLLYSGYLTNIPVALEEAARVDGASTWKTYWSIIFPIMKPMHATVAVLTALGTWNDKLAEIWTLLTQDPATFKGGGIWQVMLDINGALKAIGYGLLVLFFAVGVVKTCGSFTDVKRPEHALKLFIRFALAKAAVTYGLDLMLAVFKIVQGIISTIITQSGLSGSSGTTLPQEIIDKINNVGFWDSIPLWAVTLLGGLFITVLSFIMILTVYSRMFKLYMYTALAPIPLSSFAGEPTSNVGKNFLRSYAGVCLEGAIIALACIIFSVMAASPPAVDPNVSAVTAVWSYVGELIFNLLVLVGAVRMSDRIVKELLGL